MGGLNKLSLKSSAGSETEALKTKIPKMPFEPETLNLVAAPKSVHFQFYSG